MDVQTAKVLSELYLRHAREQDRLLEEIQKEFAVDDFKQARALVGKVMGAIYLDALQPLFVQHPSLRPKGIDP